MDALEGGAQHHLDSRDLLGEIDLNTFEDALSTFPGVTSGGGRVGRILGGDSQTIVVKDLYILLNCAPPPSPAASPSASISVSSADMSSLLGTPHQRTSPVGKSKELESPPKKVRKSTSPVPAPAPANVESDSDDYGDEDFEDANKSTLDKSTEEEMKEEEDYEDEFEEDAKPAAPASSASEDGSYGDDDFDEFDENDDEPKKVTLFEPRRVSFLDVLVTATRERPRTAPSDVRQLFYTEDEIAKFEDLAFVEESRGLPVGSLDEETYEREQAERNREGEMWRNGVQTTDDPDAMETYSDYSDESFDKAGFGSSDDNF